MNHLLLHKGSSSGIPYAKQRTSPQTCRTNEQENGDKDSLHRHTLIHTHTHISKGYRQTQEGKKENSIWERGALSLTGTFTLLIQ